MAAPRMAAAKAFRREPASANRAVMSDGIRSINRTGRCEAASARRPEECAQRRGNHHAVKPHKREEDVLNEVHLSNPA